MKLKLITLWLLTLPLLCACSSDDDIEGIFVGRTWYITEVFGADGKSASTELHEQILNEPDKYCITFAQGTFVGVAGNAHFEGKWSAGDKDRSIQITLTSKTNVEGLTNHITTTLEDAVRYVGDYNQLRIYSSGDTSILFRPSL